MIKIKEMTRTETARGNKVTKRSRTTVGSKTTRRATTKVKQRHTTAGSSAITTGLGVMVS